ncbi:MAG: DUF1450 domain-containing protein [Bacilli bacterium]|nr:DUF1450 domain-containing protein [Bacilli bacterium]MDD4298246.1 DUF1450 domain-containing protein [Bacilli bacterium]MDD4644101.1 DUF1450 domain-containing protein [Bacilli bacterium]
MNEFKLCDICEAVNSESLIKRLKEIDPEAEIVVGCQGFCGIGATKPFVIVNGMPAIADTEDEVIEKVKEILNN